MRIEVMDIEKTRNEAKKYISHKLPLVSKVSQFNRIIGDIKLEYIEFKVLKYEVIIKNKSKNLLRSGTKKEMITMLVNTCNGHSESVDNIPNTSKKYVSKSCIRKNIIDDNDLVDVVKKQIISYLTNKLKYDNLNKINIEINMVDIKSIYKPYWVGDFSGRNIFIDS